MKFNTFRTRKCLGDAKSTHGRGQNMRFLFHQLPHRTNKTAILVHLGMHYKMHISPS